LEDIKQQLTSQDRNIILATLREVRPEHSEEVAPLLLDMLATTEDAGIRNALAITLSDLDVTELVPTIAKLLQDQNLLSSAGSLIYSIRKLNYSSILSQLAWVIDKGSYEATLMTLMLFEDLPTHTENYKIVMALDILKREYNEQEDKNKKAYIKKAIRVLEKKLS
jgi:hypothetical protein